MNYIETSRHPLNVSPSKQLYTFSKAPRFTPSKSQRSLMYNLPSTLGRMSPSMGLGRKTSFAVRNKSPSPTTYTLPTSFTAKTNKGVSFGASREKCKAFSARRIKSDPQVPGPGAYYRPGTTQGPKWSLLNTRPNPNFKRDCKKNHRKSPGPGTYRIFSVFGKR